MIMINKNDSYTDAGAAPGTAPGAAVLLLQCPVSSFRFPVLGSMCEK